MPFDSGKQRSESAHSRSRGRFGHGKTGTSRPSAERGRTSFLSRLRLQAVVLCRFDRMGPLHFVLAAEHGSESKIDEISPQTETIRASAALHSGRSDRDGAHPASVLDENIHFSGGMGCQAESCSPNRQHSDYAVILITMKNFSALCPSSGRPTAGAWHRVMPGIVGRCAGESD